jgi:hypothetical protein
VTNHPLGSRAYCSNVGRVVTVLSHDDEGHLTVADEHGNEWIRACWQLDELDDALTLAWRAISAIGRATEDATLGRLANDLSRYITDLHDRQVADAVKGLRA